MSKEKFLKEVNRLKGNTNLKSEKIMLAEIAEVSSMVDYADERIGRLNDFDTEAFNVINELITFANNRIGTVEDKLGTNYETVVFKILPDLEQMKSEFGRSIEDLGVDPTNVDEYNRLQDRINEIDDNKQSWENTLTDLQDVWNKIDNLQ